MKAFVATVLATLALLLLLGPGGAAVDAAAIICGDDAKTITTSTTAPRSAGVEGDDESLPNKEAMDGQAATTTTTTTTETSDVKLFFRTVQCTLEKARPWVEEIEKEAKRLEQTAKRFGEGVFHRLGDFVDKLISSDEASNSPTISLLTRLIGGGVGGQTKPSQEVENENDESQPQTEVEETAAVVIEDSSDSPSSSSSSSSSSSVSSSSSSSSSSTTTEDELDNQIHGEDLEGLKQICPQGFVADVNGVCRRVSY